MCFMYFWWVEAQNFRLSGTMQKITNSCLITFKPMFWRDMLELYRSNLRVLLNLTVRPTS